MKYKQKWKAILYNVKGLLVAVLKLTGVVIIYPFVWSYVQIRIKYHNFMVNYYSKSN